MRAKLLLIVLAVLLVCFPASAQEQLAHAIFVKVNGKTITQDNVVQAVKYLIKREYNDVVPEDEEEFDNVQKAALRDLIRTILIHDEATALNLKVDRNRLRHLMTQTGLKSEEVTPTIRRMLEADDLFEDIMASSGTPINPPSPRQMREFYNENREEFRSAAFVIIRTIFIAEDGKRPQSYFKDQAEMVIRELEAIPVNMRTDAFAKKAREISEDVFAKFGGLLTADSPEKWIPKEFENVNSAGDPIFPQAMVEAIKRLNNKGEMRLAVSADGMHIMYCEDTQGGRIIPWEEASRIIEYVLKQRTRNARMASWLSRVYDRSDVRWHDGSKFEKELLTEELLPSEHRRD